MCNGWMQIESKFILSTKLSVEGPLRMKEEYVEGVLEMPIVVEETVPDQLKAAFGQAANTIQQLPLPIRDAFSGGLKVPLSKILFIYFIYHTLNLYSRGCVYDVFISKNRIC